MAYQAGFLVVSRTVRYCRKEATQIVITRLPVARAGSSGSKPEGLHPYKLLIIRPLHDARTPVRGILRTGMGIAPASGSALARGLLQLPRRYNMRKQKG